MKKLCFSIFAILLLSAFKNKEHKKDIISNPEKFYEIAYSFRESGKRDSAFKYYNLAKDEFLLQKDSFNVAKCLVNMAIIASNVGDFYGSIEISLDAIPYLNQHKEDHLDYIHRNYNSIGFSNYRLRNYSNALKFYDLALKSTSDSSSIFLYQNNKAKVYEEIKNYNEAIKIYTSILKDIPKETTLYAKALANLATTKWMQNPAFDAAADLLVALKIYINNQDLFGQNYCYAWLANFYSEKNNALALNYSHKMYKVAKELNSPQDQLEALYKLVKLSSDKESKQYFIVYEKLDDSLQFARSSAKNQFALIRYDTLKLEKENTEKKYQLIQQRITIYIIITIVGLSILCLIFWYGKRKKRLQQEKELEVKKTELKYAKKVHDRVANKVYNVMMEVENTEDFDKTALADKLEAIYNISRDISYERSDLEEKVPYEQQIQKMLFNYSSDVVDVLVEGNNADLWIGTTVYVKSEIMHVLLELMTNMIKHSQATKVILMFERVNNLINIVYQDNGIGISRTLMGKNGLINTENRMADINGTINFETGAEKGLKIKISFPVI